MKRARLFIPLLALIMFSVIAMPDHYRTARQDDSKELGFPFEMVSEEFLCCFAPPTWRARVGIPRDFYSKKNLDRLFRFYSLRHPNMKERLYVYVYAGGLNRPGELRSDEPSVPRLPKDGDELQTKLDSNGWDALFDREGYGSGAGRDESYSYRPDIEKDEKAFVILKGTLINRPKQIVESWKTSNGKITVRVLAYYLQGVDPAGVYYTFQSFKADPEWPDWKSIITSQQDQGTRIPKDSVVFLTNTTAYLMMGSMYAVTTDAGANWTVWDAERDFEPGRWCENWVIGRVEITTLGNGTMSLSPSSQSGGKLILHTSDFGRSWRSE